MGTLKKNLIQFKNKCHINQREFHYDKQLAKLDEKISKENDNVYDKIFEATNEILENKEKYH